MRLSLSFNLIARQPAFSPRAECNRTLGQRPVHLHSCKILCGKPAPLRVIRFAMFAIGINFALWLSFLQEMLSWLYPAVVDSP